MMFYTKIVSILINAGTDAEMWVPEMSYQDFKKAVERMKFWKSMGVTAKVDSIPCVDAE